jgi:hypothetical protein
MSESDRRFWTVSPPFFKGLKKIPGKLELVKEKSDCPLHIRKGLFCQEKCGYGRAFPKPFFIDFLGSYVTILKTLKGFSIAPILSGD